jgi:hypothetical protein
MLIGRLGRRNADMISEKLDSTLTFGIRDLDIVRNVF